MLSSASNSVSQSESSVFISGLEFSSIPKSLLGKNIGTQKKRVPGKEPIPVLLEN